MSTTNPKSSWLHLRLSHLFLLQLLLVPLFLAPLYDRLDLEESKKTAHEFHNVYGHLLQGVAYLLAPAIYTAVFAYWSARRALALQPPRKRSVVFAAIRGGAAAGFIFGALLSASYWINWNWLGERQRFEDAGISSGSPLAQDLLIAISLCVYLLPVGASLGGLIGLAVDARMGRRSSS